MADSSSHPSFHGKQTVREPSSLLIGCLFLVLIVELLNSAIETAIDYQSTDIHPMAKLAKDFGSAAVMLSIINVLVIWGLFLWNYFS